ncbi:S1 family peptidase [Xylanimonas oleitrophica]|uniref:S1 family peptidase n=1 Tax=Xylanimonas oleitrophica TaxID=2607479 RepID=A0A2W5XS29_9MICO|nr:S1 family peptidase [Xylanimonas oleitrophica]PZR52588.1 S1 family peptidase [Xylanimonas oleitrophica]
MRWTQMRGMAVTAASLTLVAGTLTAQAAPAAAPLDEIPGAEDYAPGLLRAMERDLGMAAERAIDRLEFQDEAAESQELAAETLESYAGTWLDPEKDELFVAVADPAEVAVAEALGATVVTVERTAEELETFRAALDAPLSAAGTEAVPSWYVDATSNTVVVSVTEEGRAAAEAAVAAAGVPADAVTLETTTEAPRTLIDVVGGNAYYIGSGSRCSVGFAVNDGFITAGHCGRTGATTSSPNGTFVGSSFPGNDYAYVRVGSGNTLIGAVNNYSGGRVAVRGSQQASVGASVCRSGSTTGWHCGTIQAFNSTVNYAEGSVRGLIRTNVCAEPGDSGGSLLAGNQAQGLTSGGSGNCRTGGTTYFQPVNPVLSAYGLSLRTS